MLKHGKPLPIDPEDGLPNVPAMVDNGMAIHEALAIWAEANSRLRLEAASFQEPRQSVLDIR